MDSFDLDHVPANLPGGFFIYEATGSETLCFVDQNVLDIYGCETINEFRAFTGNSFRGLQTARPRKRQDAVVRCATLRRNQTEHQRRA